GKPVDGRSDIFSLGVILYEMVTGEKPFPGQNITTVIYKIINEEPIPPQSLDSSIHTGLSNVIRRALAKDPAGRYQTCHEFLAALKNYHDLNDPDATQRTVPVNSQAKASAIRTPGPSTRPPSSAVARNPVTDSGVLLIPASTENEGRAKRGSFLLTVILLGIIGFAGYRVWPPMMDIWQRMHQEGPLSPVKPASAVPENSTAKPASETAPGPKSDSTSPDLKSNPEGDASTVAKTLAIPEPKGVASIDAGTPNSVQPDSGIQGSAPPVTSAHSSQQASLPLSSTKPSVTPDVAPAVDSAPKAVQARTPAPAVPVSAA